MKSLTGRVAVVTGGGSGLGRAMCQRFGQEGMHVVLADVMADRVEQAAKELTAEGLDVTGVQADVTSQESVNALRDATLAKYGAVHVVCNNAGIGAGAEGKLWEHEAADWKWAFAVNLWGVIHGIRAFVPRILASGEEGHVVNTGSMASVMALARLGPYTVAKHGVLGLSDVLRAEMVSLQAPVGVSVVMPGMIKTGMNPVGIVSSATVAANVVDAIRRGRDYVFTDDHSTDQVDERLRAILAARRDVIG